MGGIVFAVDAGPRFQGTATVRLVNGNSLELIQGTHRAIDPHNPADLEWIADRVADVHALGGTVVAEFLRGTAYTSSRVQDLIETGRAEGGLQWLTLHLGAKHDTAAATDVRRDMVLDGQASDARIAVVVEWLYGSAIRARITDEKQRPHIYDAMLLAAWWLFREAKQAVTLAPHIVAKLAQMRAAELAARATKKAAKRQAAPVAKLLAAICKARAQVPPLSALGQRVGMSEALTVQALWVVARGRSDAATSARGVLKAAGQPATDPAKKKASTKAAKPKGARKGKAA